MNSQRVDTDIEFQRVRFEFCVSAYIRELERKESLEKKSQFFVSLLTLILGALFLNADMLAKVNALTLASIALNMLFNIFATILVISLSVALISVLFSLWLQDYVREYPKNIVSSLFDPNSTCTENKTPSLLLESLAMNCALALEINKRTNDRKAKWVTISSVFTLISVIVLALILIIVSVSLYIA